jgi:hypothetical protein
MTPCASYRASITRQPTSEHLTVEGGGGSYGTYRGELSGAYFATATLESRREPWPTAPTDVNRSLAMSVRPSI